MKSLYFHRCIFFFHLLTNFIMKFMLNLIQRGEKICSDTSQAPGGDVQL